MNCKNQIKEWLNSFLQEIQKIGLNNIYSLQNNKAISIQEIVEDESFLFYSYEDGTEEKEYLITKKNYGQKLKANPKSFTNDEDSLLLVNDHDGIGLGFMMIDDKVYKEIFEIKSTLSPSWRDIPEHIV